MARAICDGAARNSALSMRKRLISSHNSRPPATESSPAKRRRSASASIRGAGAISAGRDSGGLTVLTPSLVTLMAVSYALIGNLRHARKQQAVDGEIGGEIAEAAQRIDYVADFTLGNFAGGLEQVLVAKKAIGFFDVVLADPAHLHLQLDRSLVVVRIVEPGDAFVITIKKAFQHVGIRRRPVAIDRHAGERHVGQIIEGEAEVGVAFGLGIKV